MLESSPPIFNQKKSLERNYNRWASSHFGSFQRSYSLWEVERGCSLASRNKPLWSKNRLFLHRNNPILPVYLQRGADVHTCERLWEYMCLRAWVHWCMIYNSNRIYSREGLDRWRQKRCKSKIVQQCKRRGDLHMYYSMAAAVLAAPCGSNKAQHQTGGAYTEDAVQRRWKAIGFPVITFSLNWGAKAPLVLCPAHVWDINIVK